MKRHSSLIPLSRFHRSVLFTAQMAKKNGPKFKGYPTEVTAKADYAIDFYEQSLSAHFEVEELQLFPALTGFDPELDRLVEEMIQEHEVLRKLFAGITSATDLEVHMDKLGFTLEAHVRKEERQLFQLAQEVLSEAALLAIGEKLK